MHTQRMLYSSITRLHLHALYLIILSTSLSCSNITTPQQTIALLNLSICTDTHHSVSITALPSNATLYNLLPSGSIQDVILNQVLPYTVSANNLVGVFPDVDFVGTVEISTNLSSSPHLVTFTEQIQGHQVADGAVVVSRNTTLEIVLQDYAIDIDYNDTNVWYYISVIPDTGSLLQHTGSVIEQSEAWTYVTSDNGTIFYQPAVNDSGLSVISFTFGIDDGNMRSPYDGTISIYIVDYEMKDLDLHINQDSPVQLDETIMLSQDSLRWISLPLHDDHDTWENYTITINSFPSVVKLFQIGVEPHSYGTSINQSYRTLTSDTSVIAIVSSTVEINDSFSFIVQDGHGALSQVTTVTIIVESRNGGTAVTDRSLVTDENNMLLVVLEVDHVTTNCWTAVITCYPESGLLFQVSGLGEVQEILRSSDIPVNVSDGAGSGLLHRVIYIPSQSSQDSVQFCFKAIRCSGDISEEGIIEISVISGDNIPDYSQEEFIQQTVTVYEDSFITFNLTTNNGDASSTEMVFAIISLPEKGLLKQISGNLITASGEVVESTYGMVQYMPPDNQYGESFTSFYFTATDTGNISITGKITIDVTPMNDPPVAYNSSVSVPQNKSFSVNVNDIDDTSLFIYLTELPKNGMLFYHSEEPMILLELNMTISAEKYLLYMSGLDNPKGSSDYFCFKVTDGSTSSNEAIINISIFDERPVVNDIEFLIDEDSMDTISLEVYDTDSDLCGESFDVFISSLPERGSLYQLNGSKISQGNTTVNMESCSTWSVQFSPIPDTFSVYEEEAIDDYYATFEFYAFDGNTESLTATVSIKVKNINDPPVVTPSRYETTDDVPIVIHIDAYDLDNDSLALRVMNLPNPKSEGIIYQYISGSKGHQITSNGTVLISDEKKFYFKPSKVVSNTTVTLTIEAADGRSVSSNNTDILIIPGYKPPELTSFDVVFTSVDDEYVIDCEKLTFTTDVNCSDYLIEILTRPDRGNLYYEFNVSIIEEYPTIPSKSFRYEPDDPGLDGVMGASIPYSTLVFRVYDNKNVSNSSTITISVACPHSYYVHVWNEGEMCSECPYGAICSEYGEFYPTNDYGFWISDYYLWTFVECFPASACLASSLNVYDADLDLWNTTSHICSDGYTGNLCGKCDESFFRFHEYCYSCDSTISATGWFVFALVILIVIFAFLTVFMESESSDIGTASIVIGFIQTMAVIIYSRRGHDDPPVDGVFSFFFLLHSASCYTSQYDFETNWIISSLIPFCVLGIVVVSILSLAVLKFVHRCFADIPARIAQTTFYIFKLQRFCIAFVVLSYILPVYNSILFFVCEASSDGKYVFYADFSLYCYDDWWLDLFGFSVLQLLFWVFAVPLYLGYIFFISRPPSIHTVASRNFPCIHSCKNPQIERDRFLELIQEQRIIQRTTEPAIHVFNPAFDSVVEIWNAKYGIITLYYDPICFYWEVIVALRKLLIASTATISTYSTTHITVNVLILSLAIVLQVWTRPYKSKTNNLLEGEMLLTCLLVAVVLLLDKTTSKQEIILYSLNLTVTVLMIFVLFHTIYIYILKFVMQLRHYYPYLNRFFDDWDGFDNSFTEEHQVIQRERSESFQEDQINSMSDSEFFRRIRETGPRNYSFSVDSSSEFQESFS